MAKKRSVKKVVEENVKKAPVGVQIISVIYYISAALCALFGLLMIFGANYIVSVFSQIGFTFSPVVFIVFGVIFIGVAILSFFVGRGLWKLKLWAKVLAIIFACLGILVAICYMIKGFTFMQLIILIIDAVIGAYLIFSKEVKTAFK